MPVQPGRSDVHVNRSLTNVSVAFIQSSDAFVADRVFPTIPSDNRSDDYFVYPRGAFNRNEMKDRAPATESAGGAYKITTDTFSCRRKGFHRDIPNEIVANADAAIRLQMEATQFVTLKGLIEREVRWVTTYFTAGNPGDTWTFDVDGASSASAAFDPTNAANNNKVYWDNAASTPIEDIRQGKRYVQSRTGFRPNVLTLSRVVYDVLLDHPDIVGRLDRGQTSGTATVTRQALAALFELDEILVLDGIVDNGPETQAVAGELSQFIAGNHALLSYRPMTPGLMTPSAGYTFNFTGFLGLTDNGMRIRNFMLDDIDSERVEIDSYYDQKLVSADLGYFFGSIVENS